MAKRSRNAAPRDETEDSGASGRILAEYLSEVKAIRATGAAAPETSYYPARAIDCRPGGSIIALFSQKESPPVGGL
jgi:hypothetical protein